MKERTVLSAILKGKCPQCRKGDLFVHGPFHKKFGKMYDFCPKCDLKYEREPWFFYGAMYVSYAISVAVFIVISALVYVIGQNPDLNWYIGSVVAASIITYPLNFRISRVLYLYGFGGVRYNRSKSRLA